MGKQRYMYFASTISMDLYLQLQSGGLLFVALFIAVFVCRQLAMAKQGFTVASLSILANHKKRLQLQDLLKSLHTIKTLVSIPVNHIND